MNTEDRWYVRFRGHTLGPLTSEQVKSSVRRKELGPDDKLASALKPNWRALRTESEFLQCWEALTRPIPTELAPLPSPKILWQKKRAVLPVAPENKPAAAPAGSPVEHSPVAVPTLRENPQTRASKNKVKAKPRGKTAVKAKAAKKSKPATVAKAKKITPAESSAPTQFAAIESKAQPELSPSLAAIPPKPELQAVRETASQIAAAPAEPVMAASPKLAEDTLSLLEALRDWNRKEKESLSASAATSAVSAPEIISAPIPAPALSTEAFSPAAFSRPDFTENRREPGMKAKEGIELKLNLVVSKQFIFISALITAAVLAAVLFTLSEAKKMRGPVSSRLPDPSSPTIEPSSENDPIPQLKAPTRPRRD